VAGARELALGAPADGAQFFAQRRVLHDDEAPGLEAERAGRQPAGFEDEAEILVGNPARRVEVLQAWRKLKACRMSCLLVMAWAGERGMESDRGGSGARPEQGAAHPWRPSLELRGAQQHQCAGCSCAMPASSRRASSSGFRTGIEMTRRGRSWTIASAATLEIAGPT